MIPFYVQEVGATDLARVKIWVVMIQPPGSLVLAAFAPVWGELAGPFGRRMMFLRALLGGALVMVCVVLTTAPQQLTLFRGLGGVFAGAVSAPTALIATTAPRERIGYCLGMIHTGILGGAAVGSMVRGVSADLFSSIPS